MDFIKKNKRLASKDTPKKIKCYRLGAKMCEDIYIYGICTYLYIWYVFDYIYIFFYLKWVHKDFLPEVLQF